MISIVQYLLPASLTLLPMVVSAQQISLTGIVRDAASGIPLTGAFVRTADDSVGSKTDAQGRYALALPKGAHRLMVSYMGYQTQEFDMTLSQSFEQNFHLQPLSQRMDEVIVTDSKKGESLTDPQMSTVHLNTKEMSTLPVLFGEKDLLKTIQLLPGVQSGGEGSTNFNVRGGDAGQNLILLDQATIYNASHLLGFFSTFNSDAIKDIQLYKGDIPAQYGGRIASVLDIGTLNGNQKQFAAEGGIGIIASRLKVEGPIEKGKSSFLLSARRSYADSFLKLAKNKDMANNTLYFYDLNGKLSFNLGKKTAL